MRYPVLIEDGLPGCFSAGDTLDEAIEAARDAAAAWIESALEHDEPIPRPSSLQEVRKLRGYSGWTAGLIDVDAA